MGFDRLRSRLGDAVVAVLAAQAEHRPEYATSEAPPDERLLYIRQSRLMRGLFTTLAATFKNFDLSVQSPMPVRSLRFESHRGDHRRADIRRWQ